MPKAKSPTAPSKGMFALPPRLRISKHTNKISRGLVAVHYFGCTFACFIGRWAGDKLGCKRGVFIGACFCMLGAALMTDSTNANMFNCASSLLVSASAPSTPSSPVGLRALPGPQPQRQLLPRLRRKLPGYHRSILVEFWSLQYQLRLPTALPTRFHVRPCPHHRPRRPSPPLLPALAYG